MELNRSGFSLLEDDVSQLAPGLTQLPWATRQPPTGAAVTAAAMRWVYSLPSCLISVREDLEKKKNASHSHTSNRRSLFSLPVNYNGGLIHLLCLGVFFEHRNVWVSPARWVGKLNFFYCSASTHMNADRQHIKLWTIKMHKSDGIWRLIQNSCQSGRKEIACFQRLTESIFRVCTHFECCRRRYSRTVAF